MTSLVSSKFLSTVASTELDLLRDGYVDLSTHCLHCFVDLIFKVDFRSRDTKGAAACIDLSPGGLRLKAIDRTARSALIPAVGNSFR